MKTAAEYRAFVSETLSALNLLEVKAHYSQLYEFAGALNRASEALRRDATGIIASIERNAK